MNILIVGPAHPLRGGIAALNERLAQTLAQAGHEVEILSFSLQYPGFLFPGTSQFTTDPPPPGLRVRARLNSINPFNWLRVGWQYRHLPIDLVIIRFWLPFMGPCLGTVARLLRRPGRRIVALVDNAVPHEARPGDRWFTQYFLGGCQGCLAMSRAVQADLARLAPGKPTAYSPHPVYDSYGDPLPKAEARQRLQLPADGRYLLFFGLIRAYKGLDLLLEAFADGRLKAAGVRLIVAGEYYDDRAKYEAIIDRLGLAPYLVLATHFIPNGQVAWYFGAADLVVQPYRTATQSGVTQIGYHFGKPMLVTDTGGLAETIPHGRAGYVVPLAPAAIADAILDFFENNREAAMSQGVAEEKVKYSWPTFIGQLLAVGQ
ncbi:MAG: glycosyltransferase [Bernardetiaceae bacterium]|jgi:glycosyltransferase involved in cell wall biosynthesis|nr:glycosyltransferase [Bernardetiaceae bacterium]